MQFEELFSFLDRETGEVTTVSRDLLLEAEECGDDEEPDFPAWQRKEWEIAKRIVSADCFLKLPSKFDIHEWSIMEDFSRSVEHDRIREELLRAIQAPGHSAASRTLSGGTVSKQPGLHSARRP